MVLPVKLAVAQLVEAFPAFVKPDSSLAWPYSPHVPFHSTYLTSISVWFSCQSLGLLSGLFPSYFPNKTVYVSHLYGACQMPRSTHRPCFDHSVFFKWSIQIKIMKPLIMEIFSKLLLSPPTKVQIFSWASCSGTHTLSVWETSFKPIQNIREELVLFVLVTS